MIKAQDIVISPRAESLLHRILTERDNQERLTVSMRRVKAPHQLKTYQAALRESKRRETMYEHDLTNILLNSAVQE